MNRVNISSEVNKHQFCIGRDSFYQGKWYKLYKKLEEYWICEYCFNKNLNYRREKYMVLKDWPYSRSCFTSLNSGKYTILFGTFSMMLFLNKFNYHCSPIMPKTNHTNLFLTKPNTKFTISLASKDSRAEVTNFTIKRDYNIPLILPCSESLAEPLNFDHQYFYFDGSNNFEIEITIVTKKKNGEILCKTIYPFKLKNLRF